MIVLIIIGVLYIIGLWVTAVIDEGHDPNDETYDR